MTPKLLGSYDQNNSVPQLEPRGERVAKWVERHMRDHGLSVGEIAFSVHADKRDVRRLLNDRSCGSRLEDSLATHFGWAFVEDVMTPAIGADPLTAREQELAKHQVEITAINHRLARDRAARAAISFLFDVGRGEPVPALQGHRSGGNESPIKAPVT